MGFIDVASNQKLKTLLSLICILFANLCWGQIQAGSESYDDRPDITSVTGTQEDLPSWNRLLGAHLEAAAELVYLYPDYQIYFLARDSEYLYDFTKIMTIDDADARFRIHLLNISRLNMRASNVLDYLAQEGISEQALARGTKILFVDTGFSGTIPRVLTSYFPKFANQLKAHLLTSSNSSHPSTRVFLQQLNPSAVDVNPASLHGTIVDYEHLPHFTSRSNGFAEANGRWVAIDRIGDADDGGANKSAAIKYQKHLKWFAERIESRQLFSQRRKLFVNLAHLRSAPEELKQALQNVLSAGDALPESNSEARGILVLDVDDTLLKEAPREFRDNPLVQTLIYQPSEERLQRYRQRVFKSEAGKVVHYDIDEVTGTLSSYVILRPFMTKFFERLQPYLKNRSLRVVVGSANDFERTKAVYEQVRLSPLGTTAQQMGVELADPAMFVNSDGSKDVKKLRIALNVPDSIPVFCIDDLASRILIDGVATSVYQPQVFDAKAVQALLSDLGAKTNSTWNITGENMWTTTQSWIDRQIELSPSMRQAIVRDFVEVQERNYNFRLALAETSLKTEPELPSQSLIHLADVGLDTPPPLQLNNKNELIKKYPAFTTYLEDPETGIATLLEKKDMSTLGALVDVVNDVEFLKILVDHLRKIKHPDSALASLTLALMNKGKVENEHVTNQVLIEPAWGAYPELMMNAIHHGDPLSVAKALAKPHWGGHPEFFSDWLDVNKDAFSTTAHNSEIAKTFRSSLLAETHPTQAQVDLFMKALIFAVTNKSVHLYFGLIRPVVTSSGWIEQEIALACLMLHLNSHVDKFEVDDLIGKIFNNPVSAHHPALLQMYINSFSHRSSYSNRMVATLTKKHWIGQSQWISKLVEQGHSRAVAHQILSRPGWESFHDADAMVIEAGAADSDMAKFVLPRKGKSQRPDLVEKLIRRGGVGTELAMYTLSTPEWAQHPELVKLLLELSSDPVVHAQVTERIMPQYLWTTRTELLDYIVDRGLADRSFVIAILANTHNLSHQIQYLRKIIARGAADSEIKGYLLNKSYWLYNEELRKLVGGQDPTVESIRNSLAPEIVLNSCATAL